MSKKRIYLLGIGTLLMAPAGWLLQGLPPVDTFMKVDTLAEIFTLFGLMYGGLFGMLVVLLTRSETAQKSFSQQLSLIRSLDLHFWDIVFLSLCAGIGEEFLFRIAVQEWLHPILTSILFVAIHGYILPKDWDTTKYGLLVLVFILGLSYAVSTFGIWFCIAAHAMYDFVLFWYWSRYKSVF